MPLVQDEQMDQRPQSTIQQPALILGSITKLLKVLQNLKVQLSVLAMMLFLETYPIKCWGRRLTVAEGKGDVGIGATGVIQHGGQEVDCRACALVLLPSNGCERGSHQALTAASPLWCVYPAAHDKVRPLGCGRDCTL